MRLTRLMNLALCLAAATAMAASAQGKGGGKGHGEEHKADKAQSRGVAKQNKPDKAQSRGVAKQNKPDKVQGRSVAKDDKPDKAVKIKPAEVRESGGEVSRPEVRVLSGSNKHGERLVGRAIAKANKRGISDETFVVTPSGRRLQIHNRAGDLLVDLDDDRDVGIWRAVVLRETDKKGSPSFCRSGEGHPVWGRHWCVDKGFGLGVDHDFHWARVIGIDNLVFRPQTTTDLVARNVLLDVLGDVVFNRLATHAISLGFADPLSGRWMVQPSSQPRVLLVSSGVRPIAEVVDLNNDNRADLLLVATRP